MENINQKIEELVSALRSHAPKNQVSFTLFVNCSEVEIKEVHKTPEDLKAQGCSMRNLKREFIK